MNSIPTFAITVVLFIFISTSIFSQVDSTHSNWIAEFGVSHRFSSKASNELGTDQSGVQYNLDIGCEWKTSDKYNIGFLLTGQLVGENYDAYFSPMISWRYVPSIDWSHRLALGPILAKSYNDVGLIDGFSLSYELEISDKIAITNRFDILNDSKISPIFSYAPGVELRGKFGKFFITSGSIITGIGAIIIIPAISRSN